MEVEVEGSQLILNKVQIKEEIVILSEISVDQINIPSAHIEI